MQPEGGMDEGFSPLRVARAGRRAGRHVAVSEPEGAGVSSAGPVGNSSTYTQEQSQEYVRSGSQREPSMQPTSGEDHSMSARSRTRTQEEQPQPSQQSRPQQQHQQQEPQEAQQLQPQQQGQPGPQPQATPVKRVGFSLEGTLVGPSDGEAGRQQNFTGISRRKQEQLQREQQSQAKQRNKYDEKLVDALLDVPELEEVGKEDITRIVAQAPKATTPHVQPISELEGDQAWVPAQTARSTDISLSLLTSCLLPSAQVVEAPDVWDYSLLFSQLKAELQNEDAVTDNSGIGAHNAEDPIAA